MLAHRGNGEARVRLVRDEVEGPARLVVQAGPAVLDAVAAPGEAFGRGDPCLLSLRGAHVFSVGGARARAG